MNAHRTNGRSLYAVAPLRRRAGSCKRLAQRGADTSTASWTPKAQQRRNRIRQKEDRAHLRNSHLLVSFSRGFVVASLQGCAWEETLCAEDRKSICWATVGPRVKRAQSAGLGVIYDGNF